LTTVTYPETIQIKEFSDHAFISSKLSLTSQAALRKLKEIAAANKAKAAAERAAAREAEQAAARAAREAEAAARKAAQAVVMAGRRGFTANVLEDHTLEITGYTGNARDLVIPGEINGVRITAIASGAFKNNTAFKTVAFEAPLSIGTDAFAGTLGSITLPAGMDTAAIGAIDEQLVSLYLDRGAGTYAKNRRDWQKK
jgi:hypothetical protein